MLHFALPLLGSVAGLGLAGAYGFYRYVFYSPFSWQNNDYYLPAQLTDEERARSRALIDKLNARPYERVSVTSFDGLRLAGRYYSIRQGAPLAILIHGYRGTPSRDFCGGADLLFTAGYNVLMTEQRATCSSEGHTISFGVNERYDCLTWTRYAVERFGPDVRILLVGISMGGGTVLMSSALPLPENVRGIFADCPFTSPRDIILEVSRRRGYPVPLVWPLISSAARLYGGFSPDDASALEAVKHAKVPILLIHGEEDAYVPCYMGRKIAEAAPDRIEFHTFPGARHGMSYFTDTERYTRLVTDFCRRVLED